MSSRIYSTLNIALKYADIEIWHRIFGMTGYQIESASAAARPDPNREISTSLTKSSHTMARVLYFKFSEPPPIPVPSTECCSCNCFDNILKSDPDPKLRLASPRAFYCRAITIFYHSHYPHKIRTISFPAAFRRLSSPRLPVLPLKSTHESRLKHLKLSSSSISPSSRHLFYFIFLMIFCGM